MSEPYPGDLAGHEQDDGTPAVPDVPDQAFIHTECPQDDDA